MKFRSMIHGPSCARIGLWVLSLAGIASCSWSRYDDLLRNSPVQMLTGPSDLSAYGRSVAAIRADSKSYAFATAYDGFAIYEFDQHNLTSNDPFTEQPCTPHDSCWLASSAASLNRTFTDQSRQCFAYGIEVPTDQTPRVVLACTDGLRYSLPLAEPAPDALSGLKAGSVGPTLQFASGPRLAPDWLVAALPEGNAIWLYPPNSDQPITLPPPAEAGKTFGATLAISGNDAERRLVVGEPEAGILRIYQLDGVNFTGASACIQGDGHFSTALALGHFASIDTDGLAVASDDAVAVVNDINAIALSDDTSLPCMSMTDLAEVTAALTCETLNAGNACGGLLSNVALAAADVDGDAKDELVIGAPGANDRGNDAAGKIYLARLLPLELKVVQELSPSSTESGDRFGTSVVGVPMSRPEVILAGAPGGNKLAALFCTNLLAKGQGGIRCE